MKLRDSLKIIAIAMLIESIIGAFRQPYMDNFDSLYESFGQVATIVKFYYMDVSVWLQLLLYLLFSWHIVWMGSRIPSSNFSSYFVLDAIVAIANAIVITMSYDYAVYGFFLKIIAEAAGIVTCFCAGWALYKDLHIKPVQTICLSYWVLSLRHLLYCMVLAITGFVYGLDGLSSDALRNHTTIMIAWGLVVPLLLVSRVMLFVGVKNLKINADLKEKEQELKVV